MYTLLFSTFVSYIFGIIFGSVILEYVLLLLMVVRYSSRLWGTEWLSYLIWSLYIFLVGCKIIDFHILI